jgi:hypothetical protein
VTKDNVPKSKIPEALDALRALGAKELDDIPAREAIRKMRRQIERVLRLGYTYEEVSETLAGLDVNISAERIRYLLSDIRKSTRKKSVPQNLTEITNTPVIDESALDEISATEPSSGQSVKKSQSQSLSLSNSSSKSAKPESNSTKPESTNSTRVESAKAESNSAKPKSANSTRVESAKPESNSTKPESNSTKPESNSARVESTTSKTARSTKSTKKPDEVKVSSHPNNSGLAFQPQIISDEDL